jgi:hypothetical protein
VVGDHVEDEMVARIHVGAETSQRLEQVIAREQVVQRVEAKVILERFALDYEERTN